MRFVDVRNQSGRTLVGCSHSSSAGVPSQRRHTIPTLIVLMSCLPSSSRSRMSSVAKFSSPRGVVMQMSDVFATVVSGRIVRKK